MLGLEATCMAIFSASVPLISSARPKQCRHTRASTAALCLLVLSGLGACTSRDEHGRQTPAQTVSPQTSTPTVSTPTAIFPGGGEILFSSAAGLQAAFPDGSTTTIARDFIGAEPFPGFQFSPTGELLAWTLTRENDDYYVMRLDGSDQRHVLQPTERKIPFGVQVSPDATKLAYVQSTYLGPGRERYGLFVLNLASGITTSLGAISPAGRNYNFEYKFAWNDDDSLLVQSSDRSSMDLISLRSRTPQYLSVSDRRIIAAYAEARPGVGPPAEIRPIGRTPNPYFTGLAVLVTGGNGADPAVIVLQNGPTRAFAVPPNATGVRFTWAVLGTRFLLASWVDARHGPKDWTLSVGDARTGALVRIAAAPRMCCSLLSPDGSVVVYAPDNRRWVFASVGPCPPSNECNARVQMRGSPVAWAA